MTKQDFEAVASILRSSSERCENSRCSECGKAIVRGVALGLMEYFEKQNPKFDSAKFMSASRASACRVVGMDK